MRHDTASYCRICGASCGIVVTTDGDRVVAVRGDDSHPGSQGYTCPKGRALPDLHHHSLRLDRPRLNGNATSWHVVLDDLAARLRHVIEESGPDAVGAYLGTGLAYDTAGWIAANGWLRAIGSSRLFTPATVDNAPVLHAAEQYAGHPQANPICDYTRARVVLIFGSNPVVSHGYGTATANPVVALRTVREHGGRVIAFDPVRSETAAHADQFVQVRPGSDAVVLAWLVREVLDASLTVDALDSTTAVDRAALRSALEDFGVERASAAAGVLAAELVAVRAAVIDAPGAIAAWCGTGVTMGAEGLVAELLRWALLALTGSLDTENGMRFHRGNVFGLRPIRTGVPAGTPAHGPTGPASRPELRSWLGQQPCVALADEIAGGALQALVVVGANPITAFPDTEATSTALRDLSTLAVADVVDNDMTTRASHVLAVAGQLERADLPMHEHVLARAATSYTQAVVPLGPDRRPAWWVFATLTFQMTGQHLFGSDPDALTDDAVLALVASRARVGFDEIKAAGTHGVALPSETGWVRTELRRGDPWPVAAPELLDRLATLGSQATEAAAALDGRLLLVPRRRLRANNSVADPRGRDTTVTLVHPSDGAARGIGDGEPVRLTSEHGTVVTFVTFDDRVRRGTISMSHGVAGESPGSLTSRRLAVDPLTGMPVTSGIPVRVTPIA